MKTSRIHFFNLDLLWVNPNENQNELKPFETSYDGRKSQVTENYSRFMFRAGKLVIVENLGEETII